MRSAILLVILATGAALQPAQSDAAGLQDLQAFSDAFAELTSQVSPAVVAVKTEQEIQSDRFNDPLRNHPFLQPRQRDGEVRERLGSGVIVSADGYIVTNNHAGIKVAQNYKPIHYHKKKVIYFKKSFIISRYFPPKK